MRRIKLITAVASMAMMLVVSVAPAMAADNNHNNDNFRFDRFNDGFFNPFFNGNGFNDNGVSQQNEQDVQSGDASQSINVTGGGDNSNQCAGVQGVTNTGNVSNNTGVLQATPSNNNRFSDGNNRFDNRFGFNPFFDGNRFNGDGFNNGGEVQVDNSGDFTINPTSTTSCDQQVNQAASASGF